MIPPYAIKIIVLTTLNHINKIKNVNDHRLLNVNQNSLFVNTSTLFLLNFFTLYFPVAMLLLV